ncbi:MAG: hypothetical protein QOG43_2786 [Actinomycetota bacterium]|jgi:uncharacterized membrane protein|nr:hypothetical protein [Actinomycetota bacterium]
MGRGFPHVRGHFEAVRRRIRAVAGRLAPRRDEQGAILILGSVGMVMAVIMASFAIDLGTLAQDVRRVQLVADMVALDAVRALPSNPTAMAQASAVRNGFPYTDGQHALAVEWASTALGPFTSLPANLGSATVVRVTASSVHRNLFPFVSSQPQTVSRAALSRIQPRAGFTIGSSLVTLNTSSSTLLNSLMGQAVHGTVNLSLVSWQGLASGTVGLSALQTQLASMGFSVGTVSQLLSANMTAAQLFQATASALTLGGDAANASLFNTLRLAATSSVQMNLGGLIQVAQGSENAALSSSVGLFQLVTGSALLINGTNTLSLSNAGITVPGVASTALSLKVTELPQTYIGPVGGSVTTGQVDLVVTPKIDVNLSVGLSLLRLTGDLPVRLTLGGATGTLSGATCTGITVSADPQAVSGFAQLTSLRVSTLGLLPILDVGMTSFTPTIDGPAVPLSFSYPSEFAPPAFSKHAGSQPVGLQGLTTYTSGTITLLGLIPLGLTSGSIVSAVVGALPGLIGGVDTNVLTPLLTALGLDVGSADVTALKSALNCTVPGLAG